MTTRLFALATLAVSASLLLAAAPAEAMYCGTRLIDTGDASTEVLARCGEPDGLERRLETRSTQVARRLPNGVVVFDTFTVTVEVEQWLYDFGAQRFMRALVFEGGRLVAIRTLGYGTIHGSTVREP